MFWTHMGCGGCFESANLKSLVTSFPKFRKISNSNHFNPGTNTTIIRHNSNSNHYNPGTDATIIRHISNSNHYNPVLMLP